MKKPIRAAIDTDIGTDVDDALALVVALACPELAICGVTTVYVDTALRAEIARSLLLIAGVSDIPVRAGESTPLRPARGSKGGAWEWHEGRGILYQSISKEEQEFRRGVRPGYREYVQVPPESKPAAAFLVELATQGKDLHIISIGPLTNIATAIQKSGEFRASVKGITLMGGHFGRDGQLTRPDHNFASDAGAAEIVLTSGIPVTLVSGNITQFSLLDKERLVDVLGGVGTPLAKGLLQLVSIYLENKGRTFTHLHDPMTVASLARPDLISLERRRVYYDPETALVAFQPFDGSRVSAVVSVVEDVWMAGFHDFFYERIRSMCVRGTTEMC